MNIIQDRDLHNMSNVLQSSLRLHSLLFPPRPPELF